MAVDDVTSLLDQAGVPRTNFTDLASSTIGGFRWPIIMRWVQTNYVDGSSFVGIFRILAGKSHTLL